MKLSVIIPVYNEESTIGEVISKVRSVPISKEIIVVDDGSTDRSVELVEQESKKDGDVIKIYASPVNFGKGAAIRVGLKYVTGDIVIIQDADLELDPFEYQALIEPILSGKSGVVYGSRFLKKVEGLPTKSIIANKILTTTANLLYQTSISDEATAYKVFKTDIIKNLNLKCLRFEFCPEVTAKVSKKGFKIVEVPISYNPRTNKEGKKVRAWDGIEALWTLLKYRFVD